MTYRHMETRAIEGRVVHGPFPVRWAALIFMVVGLVFALGATCFALASDSLVCVPEGTCVVTTRRPPFATKTYTLERGELTGEGRVRVERIVGAKGHVSGRVILHSDRRPERALLETSVEEAEHVAAEANLALESRRALDVTIRNGKVSALVALGLLVLGAWAAYSHFKNAGRMWLVVVRGGVALRVVRAIFGVPIASRELPLEAVEDVRVDTTEIDDFWTAKGMKTAMGRLELVDRNGAVTPLSDAYFTGKTLHYRAAAELRAILGLEPRDGGAEEVLAKTKLVVTPTGTRFGFAWLGACCGFLLGPLVTLALGVATGLMPYRDRAGGDIDTAWFLTGSALGAFAGVAIALRATRTRLPR